jgi:uncharacterized protein (TIGR03083 family)
MRDLIGVQDENFLVFAATLTEQDWNEPSLCRGWTNKDVLAHLVLGLLLPVRRLAVAMGRHRWSFDATNDLLSREHAARHTGSELIDAFDRARAHRRGIGRLLPTPLMLGDHAVHHLDIALALGRSDVLPPDIANAVLSVETRIPNPFIPAAARARGLTLRTTDTAWSRAGDPTLDVTGPADSLVSVLAGRPDALPELTGNGIATLQGRL